MVFPDLNQSNFSQTQHKPLAPIRILSVIIDYFIFAPVISFLMLVLFHNGVDVYRTFPKSSEAQSVFGYLVLGFVITATFFQALFIAFSGATPGQYFLKLRVEFSNKNYPIFLQAWARQFGFVVSFCFLGIPFLKALADENGQCFYEKMTESRVISKWPIDSHSYFYKTIEIDRKFWSASLATLSSFIIALGLVMFWKNYQYVLTSPETYAKFKSMKRSCSEFVHLDSTDRLRYSIAMNLVGTLSDACLDQEADFVLWRNFTDDRALAYFAKFVSAQNERLEGKYLKQACAEDQKSEGCYWATTFKKNSFTEIKNNADMASTFLGKVLIYEFVKSDSSGFEDLKEYTEYKSVKKYLLLESLKSKNFGQPQLRIPASTDEKKSQKSLLTEDEMVELVGEL
jgi:uncharacterized RDD family membrane protein YckC